MQKAKDQKEYSRNQTWFRERLNLLSTDSAALDRILYMNDILHMMSLPPRGAWIEMAWKWIGSPVFHVAPPRGAWMVSLAEHTLFRRASGTVPNDSQGFKMIPLRFYHIAVVDMNDRIRWNNAANIAKIIRQRLLRNSTSQMVRQPIHHVTLFCILLKPLADLRQQTTFGCHNSISHISGELRIGGGKVS